MLQEDLLWEELSARESLSMFARFKGVPAHDLDAHTDNLLSLVSLSDVADAPVTTFSGGMKRRLSVAMAATGPNTRIIFLDEPTTGKGGGECTAACARTMHLCPHAAQCTHTRSHAASRSTLQASTPSRAGACTR